MSQDMPFIWKSHWNLLELAHKLDGIGFQNITRVEVTSVSQVKGHSDMVTDCICILGVGRTQQRNNRLYQHFCLGESYSSSPCPEANQFSSSLYVLSAFPAAAPSLELRANEFSSE